MNRPLQKRWIGRSEPGNIWIGGQNGTIGVIAGDTAGAEIGRVEVTRTVERHAGCEPALATVKGLEKRSTVIIMCDCPFPIAAEMSPVLNGAASAGAESAMAQIAAHNAIDFLIEAPFVVLFQRTRRRSEPTQVDRVSYTNFALTISWLIIPSTFRLTDAFAFIGHRLKPGRRVVKVLQRRAGDSVNPLIYA